MNLNKVAEIDNIIPLQDNKDIADSYWITLIKLTGIVEGKIHIPHKKSDKLLIFEPGFPGDASTRLERLWLSPLLKNGFTVFAARHSGTIINGKFSHIYVNSPERQEEAKREKQEVLGAKRKHSIADWLNEPRVALESLAPHFNNVILAAHSFGPLAVMNSLIDCSRKSPSITKRVKKVVSLAGTFGKVRKGIDDPIMTQWMEYMDMKTTRNKITIGETKQNLRSLMDTYKKIHEQARKIPKSIDFVFVVAWGDKESTTDELVPPIESVEMISTLGKGYLIIDKTQYSNPKSDRLAHDMDNLKPTTFSKFVDLNWLPKTQISVLDQW